MAEENLRQRAERWAAANCDCNTSALAVFARAELLRAAQKAQHEAWHGSEDCGKIGAHIAGEIRKQAE